MCFGPFKVSEDLKITHKAEEMANHPAGRKYMTSRQKKKKKPWKSLGKWQFKCAVSNVDANKNLSTGKSNIESKVSRQFRNRW
jgi:hypothetical protein